MQILPTRRPKTKLGLAGLITLMLVTAAIFWGFKSPPQKNEPLAPVIRPVKVIQLAAATRTETRSFPGLVQAARETQLAFRVSGPLVAMKAQIGQRVAKGEVIAQIDPRDFEIQAQRLSAAIDEATATLRAMKKGARAEDIARLEAQLSSARTGLANAQRDYVRQEKLLAAGAVARLRFDNAEGARDAARANVEGLVQELKKARSGSRLEDVQAAEARIQRLRVDLKAARNALADTALKAPFSGIVSRKLVENFENVRAGAPIISFLDLSSVEVHSALPEDIVIRRDKIAEIACTLTAYPGRRFEATLRELGRKTDSANQSYPLTVVLHVPEGTTVEPGMAANLTITLAHRQQQAEGYLLPAGALFGEAGGDSCVWRLDPKTMTVVKTPVTIGALSGDRVQIRSGLDALDQVVTAGARFLREGQEVRIYKGSNGDHS
jgi:multidrug efflux pump subunit AcrA (membrane-fusion protein)